MLMKYIKRYFQACFLNNGSTNNALGSKEFLVRRGRFCAAFLYDCTKKPLLLKRFSTILELTRGLKLCIIRYTYVRAEVDLPHNANYVSKVNARKNRSSLQSIRHSVFDQTAVNQITADQSPRPLHHRSSEGNWNHFICACALEPVPCIALCDIGTGFFIWSFR